MHLRLAGLWPGLAAAWFRGNGRSLLLAVGFSWVLCWLLLATFVWPAWVPGWCVAMGWLLVGSFWLGESIRSQFSLGRLLENVAPNSEEAIQAAQREYLRGDWYAAEARLLEILEHHPHDVAAELALVGVLRHTKRLQTALRRLDQLELLDSAAGWMFELRRERSLIQSRLEPSSESPQEVAS